MMFGHSDGVLMRQSDIEKLERIAEQFREMCRRDSKLADEVNQTCWRYFSSGGVYERHFTQRDERGNTRVVNRLEGADGNPFAPAHTGYWATMPEPDRLEVAMWYLGGLADIANPDPIVPWPSRGVGESSDADNNRRYMACWIWVTRFASTARAADEVQARDMGTSVIRVSTCALSPMLYESMLAYVTHNYGGVTARERKANRPVKRRKPKPRPLTQLQRDVCELMERFQFDMQEVATHMGIDRTTVRDHYHAALRKLADSDRQGGYRRSVKAKRQLGRDDRPEDE